MIYADAFYVVKFTLNITCFSYTLPALIKKTFQYTDINLFDIQTISTCIIQSEILFIAALKCSNKDCIPNYNGLKRNRSSTLLKFFFHLP